MCYYTDKLIYECIIDEIIECLGIDKRKRYVYFTFSYIRKKQDVYEFDILLNKIFKYKEIIKIKEIIKKYNIPNCTKIGILYFHPEILTIADICDLKDLYKPKNIIMLIKIMYNNFLLVKLFRKLNNNK